MSSISSISMSGVSKTKTMSGISSGISTVGKNWFSVGNSGDTVNGSDSGLSHGVDSLLNVMGTSLMDNGLMDGLVGTDGSSDGEGLVDGNILEDWLGYMGGTHDRGGLVGGDRGGDVGVGGFGYWVG
jgi:hypothetical protein